MIKFVLYAKDGTEYQYLVSNMRQFYYDERKTLGRLIQDKMI